MEILNFLFISKSFGTFLVRSGVLIGIYMGIKMGIDKGIDKDINVSSLVIIGLPGLCVVLGSYLMLYAEH